MKYPDLKMLEVVDESYVCIPGYIELHRCSCDGKLVQGLLYYCIFHRMPYGIDDVIRDEIFQA